MHNQINPSDIRIARYWIKIDPGRSKTKAPRFLVNAARLADATQYPGVMTSAETAATKIKHLA